MILNCITVDDEPVALQLISSYVKQTPFLKLLASCESALSALTILHEHPETNLIFLDIRMAGLSGIELAKIVDQSAGRKNTRIIFTTAYDQYALEGYKVAALDYLLKPFSLADFSRAAIKALEYFTMIDAQTAPPQNKQLVTTAPEKEYIYLKVEYQLVKIDLRDILYIEGLKDYAKVYLQNEPKPILTLSSLKSLEEKLPSKRFLRLHRSYIVALDKIKAVTKTSVQVAGTTVMVSDQYREVFAEFLTNWV